jgi:Zn-dependent M16 (insulinase) family peptidase
LTSISNGKFDDDILDRAKLHLICELDSPVSPSSKGLKYFFEKITYEQEQNHRDAIFRVTIEDVISGKSFITIIGDPNEGSIPEKILIEK